MKKVRQIRAFSVALIVLFLATSTLTGIVRTNDTGDFLSTQSFQSNSESPYNSDQDFPFEEKEKEFEDKSETDDRSNTFTSNFFFICELGRQAPAVASEFDGFSFFNSAGRITNGLQVPLFLRNHALLI